ncbi:MAG: penicillin acylase family protein, partial [Deltaproteobacteria bacterium]|nr:penicillin acylase family protein [Deltaproteobacteria bacterium]
WSWGRLHTLTLAHALGNNNWLAPFFSLGPFPVDGDGVTVSNSYYRHSRPYDQAVGASMRMLVTLSDPIRSSVIIVPGQAGNPASPQYRDQFELWRSGRAISLAESEEEMRDWPVLVLGGSRGG